MRTICKQSCGILIVLCLLLLPGIALAAERTAPEEELSLEISFRDGAQPVVAAAFELFYVAQLSPTGEFTLSGDFADYPVQVNGLDSSGWKDLAFTLAAYTQRDELLPLDEGETNSSGLLSFPNKAESLSPGLYLLVGQRHKQDGEIYTVEPVLLCLPSLDETGESWEYDVSLVVKYSSRTEEEQEELQDYKVLKAWEDEGYAHLRPQEVVVQLLRDGQLYDSVLLNAENNWRYTWEDLSSDYSWTVLEEVPDGYQAVIRREGRSFLLTNRYQPEDSVIPPTDPEDPTEPVRPVEPSIPEPDVPQQPSLPQTGQLWWPVPLLLAAGFALCLLGLLRRRSVRHEE